MKKAIVIDDCMECPFVGKCYPWKKLSKKDRFKVTCGVGIGKFILKGCPLPDVSDDMDTFTGIN